MSKQSLGVFAQYLSHLAKLYAFKYPSLAELVRFCLIGVLGLFLDLGTVILLKETLALDTRLCAVFGFVVAVTSNFWLNRRYTFARARELPLLFSYATYVGTNLAGLALRMLVIQSMIVIAGIDRGRGYLITNLIGVVLATLVNFIGAKYFAFDPQRVQFPSQDDEPVQGRSSLPPGARRFGLIGLFALGLGYVLLTSVPNDDLHLADEGVNVTMARNMLGSREFFVRPSVFPGGRSDWPSDDLPALGNLPFYPALLAVTPRFSEFGGMKLLTFLALCVTLLCTSRLVGLVDKQAGLYTAILLATSPAFLESHRYIEFEPILTAFCAAGLLMFVHGAWQRQLLVCFVGGALVGCGFLTKMWLIVPYAFALIAFCVVEAAAVRAQGTSAGLRKSVAFGGAGFVITATAHAVFVSWVSPADLPAWLSSVYLGIFSGQGVTGGKLSAVASYAELDRPALYYPLVLYRDHFYLLPLSLFGIGELFRSPRPRTSRLGAMIIGALVAVVVLSVPAYKEARYVLPVQPFLYALCGLCLAAFARSPDKLRPNAISVVRAAMIVAVAAFVAVALAYVAGVSSEFGRSYLLAHAFGTVLCLLLGELWMRTRFVTRELVALGAIGLIGFALAAPHLAPAAPPNREIAELIAPYLSDARPGYPSYVARDHDLLQGYLARAGTGWESLPAAVGFQPEQDASLRAFVLAPADLVHTDARHTLTWLEAHARDLSPDLAAKTDGASSGYRVFVRTADHK